MKWTVTACIMLALSGSALLACKSSADKKAGPPTGSGSGGGSTTDANQKAPSSAGSGGFNTDGSGGTKLASCVDLASRACARLEQCAPFLLQAQYDDRPTCEGLFNAICSDLVASGKTVDFDRCATSLDMCGSFVESHGVPLWCWKPRGAASLGATCQTDLTCAEGLCERGKDDPAGTCAAPATEGESCVSPTRCAVGLRCAPPDYVCVRPGDDGASCASPFECQVGSKCTAKGKCAPTGVGDTCNAALLPCDTGHGQTCLLDECVAVTWADAQNSCLKGAVECVGTERCVIQQSPTTEARGDCRPTAGLGATCSSTTPCLEPLSCTSSVCGP